MNPQPGKREPTGLARRLIQESLLKPAQVASAVQQARGQSKSLLSHLINSGQLDESALARIAAVEFSLPLLDLDAFDLKNCPENIIARKLISKHRVLPLGKRQQRLSVAVADPTAQSSFNEIKFHVGMGIDPVLVEFSKLQRAIESVLRASNSGLRKGVDASNITLAPASPNTADLQEDEQPIVGFVQKLLIDAVEAGASDIHIEPYEKSYRIRLRHDGLLHESNRPPLHIANRIATRLKVMAQLNISERRLPQDGRFRLLVGGNRAVDFRLSSLPTLWGEKIVLRILDTARNNLGIDSLGLDGDQKRALLDSLTSSQGLILVTGPTGSGKTATLYAGLQHINQPSLNIATAEDPVEMQLEGVNQVQVNHKLGLDFASVLRAFLRQDPDVLMVGEIRDRETAEIAIRAAQTGHLVLSTLHTNNASESLSRLFSMGIAAFNLAGALRLIVAQRLLRRLCAHCKESVRYPENVLKKAGFPRQCWADLHLFRACGCGRCHGGYRGRIGIYEVVPIKADMARVIMDSTGPAGIADQARQRGIRNLRQSALHKVALGMTSLEEANRLT